MRKINLSETPIIGKSFNDFIFGESIEDISKIIDLPLPESPRVNKSFDNGWVYNKFPYGFDEGFYECLSYRDEALQLIFNSGVLTDIILGQGYIGNVLGVRIGDKLSNKIGDYDVFFNDQEDEFLLQNENGFLNGISFGTDCRSSLEIIPNQNISKIRLFS